MTKYDNDNDDNDNILFDHILQENINIQFMR